MVVVADKVQRRLTMQMVEIETGTIALRSLDWDRDRFDIEFGLQNGTTYNSFVIQGERTALIDTSHQKFQQLYLDALRGLIDLSQLDYLIISHTEPDHSGLVKEVLALAPQVTVVGSKVALQFLADWVHQPFQQQIVKNGDRLDLGKGHVLEFVIAPNLHWPDTIFTYDHQTQILFTCDAFGMHYCDDHTYDEELDLIEADFQYYYDCLMGPNARSVLSAMKRMDELPPIQTIATGHGPLLHHHLSELTNRYRSWSQQQAKAETTVAIFYVSDYGYSDRLAQAIAHGITKTGIAVEMVDLRVADSQEIRDLIGDAAGLVIGTPPTSGPLTTQIQTAIGTILAAAKSKQAVGLFESGGTDSEAVYPLVNRFRDLGLTPGFSPILIKETPTEATYQTCEEAGTDLGQWLSRDRSIKQMKALDTDLEKALGRISNGLYILTTQRGAVRSAMLASWVTQVSFTPLGIGVAVAKDRAIESLLHVGDQFILNVLEEGNYQGLMKHFLKRFPPGSDRFEGIKIHPASNGSPILADALAYLECEVTTRIECGDHWVLYSTIQTGRVSKPDALTAVHHRKVGNHY
ncbi:MAG: diflavin flavoprotein [Leptolyngbyaceae bacterium]|nr:diflavin flavoprotein [Leptolyngbyaceae bacterium]